jgi:hypothetical protein
MSKSIGRPQAVNRAFAIASLTACIGCSGAGIDPKKFEAVDAAGQALRAEAHSGDVGSTRLEDRLKGFETAIADAGRRVGGGREKAALRAYADAAQTYRYFRRFRDLEGDAIGGMVLLRGANRPVALRYAIPFEERGGGRWVDRRKAMDLFAAKADAELAAASRLVHGGASHE